MMKPRQISIACAIAASVALAGCSTRQDSGPASNQAAAAAPAASRLHVAMRGLWRGHIVATRNFALAVHAGNAGAAAKAEAAAIDNAKQISSSVARFYGAAAGDGMLKLLGGHWGGVKTLTLAAKTGNQATADKAMGDLAANAMEMSRLLASANPEHWTTESLNQALLMHVGDHKQQVDSMMTDAPDAQQQQLWADMQHHMEAIADALSDGIAKQFPDKVD